MLTLVQKSSLCILITEIIKNNQFYLILKFIRTYILDI